MPKHVLDIGNCAADHGAIRQLIESNFDARVVQAHAAEDAFAVLEERSIDLVVVNRRLDCDNSEGLEIIKRIKSSPALNRLPVMMITNFEDHQRLATEAGAEIGFGKSNLAKNETVERLRAFLG